MTQLGRHFYDWMDLSMTQLDGSIHDTTGWIYDTTRMPYL